MYEKFRETNHQDIRTVNQWLKGWGMYEIAEELYPPTGIIMQDESTGEGIYTGFVWKTESKLFPVGFITRNPNYKKTDKNEQTTETFIRQLLLYARDLGCSHIVTWTENQSLVKCFKEKFGFTEASNRTSELIAKII